MASQSGAKTELITATLNQLIMMFQWFIFKHYLAFHFKLPVHIKTYIEVYLIARGNRIISH